jgi:hypothetical protein
MSRHQVQQFILNHTVMFMTDLCLPLCALGFTPPGGTWVYQLAIKHQKRDAERAKVAVIGDEGSDQGGTGSYVNDLTRGSLCDDKAR